MRKATKQSAKNTSRKYTVLTVAFCSTWHAMPPEESRPGQSLDEHLDWRANIETLSWQVEVGNRLLVGANSEKDGMSQHAPLDHKVDNPISVHITAQPRR